MLYQGCVRFTQRGRLALEEGDFETARANFLRSQDIVADLMGSLNLDAGEIAANLLRLYEYMHRRLVDANIRRDPVAALEVENLVRSLLPAWEDAVRQQQLAVKTGQGGMPGTEPRSTTGNSVSLSG